MKQIIVEDGIRQVCPQFRGAAVYATFVNSVYSEGLWQAIGASLEALRERHTPDSIKQIPSIRATRQIYKALGKDPSRYRPSSEALIRRTLQGKDLYKVNTVVDLINLASIEYGYSIGGFDSDKIAGDIVRLGVGQKEEAYEGIGRGPLNIEGLPVYRDGLGGFGTPTSDHERTKMELGTSHLLAFVNGYDGDVETILAFAQRIVNLVEKYAEGSECAIVPF